MLFISIFRELRGNKSSTYKINVHPLAMCIRTQVPSIVLVGDCYMSNYRPRQNITLQSMTMWFRKDILFTSFSLSKGIVRTA